MPSNGFQPGGQGVPAFPNSDGFDLGADSEELARYAAFRGNALRGTTAERDAFAYPVEGLLWSNTTTKSVDRYSGSAWAPNDRAITAQTRKGGVQSGLATTFTNVLSVALAEAPAGRYRVTAVTGTYSDFQATHFKSVRVGGTSDVSTGTPLDGAGDWVQNWPANVHLYRSDTWFFTWGGGNLDVRLDAAIDAGSTRAATDGCRLAVEYIGPV